VSSAGRNGNTYYVVETVESQGWGRRGKEEYVGNPRKANRLEEVAGRLSSIGSGLRTAARASMKTVKIRKYAAAIIKCQVHRPSVTRSATRHNNVGGTGREGKSQAQARELWATTLVCRALRRAARKTKKLGLTNVPKPRE